MSKSPRRRCDARLPARKAVRDRAIRAGELDKYLRRNRCKTWAVRGSRRCRLHGGLSTGPTTPEGKARTIDAMKAGRTRWLARLKSEGKPIPFGRKKGSHNRPLEEREHDAYCSNVGGRVSASSNKCGLNAKRGARGSVRSARRPVARRKSTLAAKRDGMPVCLIGRKRNGRSSESPAVIPTYQRPRADAAALSESPSARNSCTAAEHLGASQPK
jgi:hypothetical protein